MQAPSCKWLPFEEARSLSRAAGLKSFRDWLRWCRDGKRPRNVPSNPQKFYAAQGGWKGFRDWLGFPPARSRRHRSDSQKKQWSTAKAEFLTQSPLAFEFQALPFLASAQLLYRDREVGEARTSSSSQWCALVLRSMPEPYFSTNTKQNISLKKPKWSDGAGIVFIVTGSRRIFFLPHEFLASWESKAASGFIYAPKKAITEFEVTTPEELQKKLRLHHEQSHLIPDGEVSSSALLAGARGAKVHSLAYQAVEFLRNNCFMKAIDRPSSSFFNAHFVYGEQTIIARCCRQKISGKRIRLVIDYGLEKHMYLDGKRLRITPSSRLPDFLLGVRQYEREGTSIATQADAVTASTRRLQGFYIFPREFFVRSNKVDRYEIQVYPPDWMPQRSDSQRTQTEQNKFYIDLSGVEQDLVSAAKKARAIFAAYARPSSDPLVGLHADMVQ